MLGVAKGEYITAEEYKTRNGSGGVGGQAWPVRVEGVDLYLDTSDPMQSNWARFLLPCPEGKQPNICIKVNKGTVGVYIDGNVENGEFLYVANGAATRKGGGLANDVTDPGPSIKPVRLPVDDQADWMLNEVNLEPLSAVEEQEPTEPKISAGGDRKVSPSATEISLPDLKLGDFIIVRDPGGERS